MMIWTWHQQYPELAEYALSLFVQTADSSMPPYGSWKDIKYFCNYAMKQGATVDHPLIQFCIKTTNAQLKADDELYQSTVQEDNGKSLSLVSKWIARESSNKFGKLYEVMATTYFDNIMKTVRSAESKEKAIKKCKTHYRLLCSKLNRHIDTIQIKQASNKWSEIDHSKTTSLTLAKQKKAIMNSKKSEEPDRVTCAENFAAYMESLKTQKKEVKGKHVGMEMFTKLAENCDSLEERDVVNSQWRDNGNQKNCAGLGPMIATVDTSGSMSGDPINAAMALGCRVAEKSSLGKRVMTFSESPKWINLDGCETFTEMIHTIKSEANSGFNTDFYKALDLILEVIEEKRVPPSDVENMILAIFSDMQIDVNLHICNGGNPASGYDESFVLPESDRTAARAKWNTMYAVIEKKYHQVGMRMYGVPLKPPHILFWNLRKTTGYPTLSSQNNTSMMSGFDSTILNLFCELGMEALKNMNPYDMFLKTLENPRYAPLEERIRKP
jgi:hypothetical protein